MILHGCALVEVLGEMGLVKAGGFYHFSLWEVVLLHVALYHFSYMPGILSTYTNTLNVIIVYS